MRGKDMQDDKRDEMISKAVEASLAIGGNSPGKDSGGVGPWHSNTTPAPDSVNSDGENSAVPTPSENVSTPAEPVASPAPVVGADSAKMQDSNTIRPQGPVGVAIGTGSITIAEGREKRVHQIKFNNTIPFESFYKNVVIEHEIPYFDISNFDYVQGYGADDIANAFHTHPWRPVPSEYSQGQDGTVVGETILQSILGRPKAPATPLYFTVPAPLLGSDNSHIFAKGTLKSFFGKAGYIAMPVDKGVAVAMSELAKDNYTGLVITVGASVCNVTLTYLSVPVVNFTIAKAGDYIDRMVAQSTSELQFKVKEIKETSFSILAKPSSRVLSGLRIYYEDVISSVISALESALGGQPPANINAPIPVVLSGGSAKPDGFQLLFEKVLEKSRLPLAISEVRVAQEPALAAAKGALVLANSEDL
jgi:hypothetical protein